MKTYKVTVSGCETIRWYKEGTGECHRKDGPAVEYVDESKEWWLNGKLHRKDGPAVECASGHKEWILNGKRHREDGPAIEYADGSKAWYLNDKCFSEKGWKKQLSPSCEGQTVVIDGIEYVLKKK